MEETWTILKVLEWTTGYFTRNKIEQPRANAEVLLAHVLEIERIQLYLNYDKPLSPEELSLYRGSIKRRAAHEPTQYITGRQEFWSLDFEVGPSVLIPRPETELLVESAIDHLGARPARVLDLCTGSGAIAVSLARELPLLSIVATDKSVAALEVAKRNAERHNVADRISFAVMDLFAALSFKGLFDLIASNPPYVSDEQFRELPPEIARFEPETALRGGSHEGLDVVRGIIQDAPLHLAPGGALLVEVGQGQAELLEPELTTLHWIGQRQFIKDYSGIPRMLHIQKKNG
jgi:release factor glutamine methyltransferase